jgi:hypothetical protein
LYLLAVHRADDFPRHFVRKRQWVSSGLVEALGPDVRARLRVDKFRYSPDLIGVLADTTSQRIIDVEITVDPANLDRLGVTHVFEASRPRMTSRSQLDSAALGVVDEMKKLWRDRNDPGTERTRIGFAVPRRRRARPATTTAGPDKSPSLGQ